MTEDSGTGVAVKQRRPVGALVILLYSPTAAALHMMEIHETPDWFSLAWFTFDLLLGTLAAGRVMEWVESLTRR